jgi:phenylacetate-coenzyme A ligase PaaK-like adenylate-forming protein
VTLPLNVHPILGPEFRSEAHNYAQWWRANATSEAAAGKLAAARAASWWWKRFAHGCSTEVVPKAAPLVTRSMLARHPGAFVGDESAGRLGYRGRTSGSTGEPLEVLMGAWAVAYYYLYLEWVLELDGRGVRPRKLVYLSRKSGADNYREPFAIGDGELVRVDLRGDQSGLEVLGRASAEVLTTTPTVLASLLDEETAVAPASLRLVLTTAEHLPEALAQRARKRLGVNVVDSYGLAEIGPVAVSCPQSRAAQAERHYHVECRGSRLELVAGELAVTTLRNRVMPLARYLPGDRASVLIDEACAACGFVGQSIVGLVGRAAISIPLASGASVSPLPWIRVLTSERFCLERYQIIVAAPSRLEVRVVGLGTNELAVLARELEEVSSEVNVEVTAGPPVVLASGKTPALVRRSE